MPIKKVFKFIQNKKNFLNNRVMVINGLHPTSTLIGKTTILQLKKKAKEKKEG